MRVDALLVAFQMCMLHKIPVNLITFDQLHAILRNVSLALPLGFELAMGVQHREITWYYQFVRVMLLGDSHSFKLVLFVPLSTLNSRFEMYRALVYPRNIGNSTYVSFQVNAQFLAVSVAQQQYFTMSEGTLQRCIGEQIKMCPADIGVSSVGSPSCLMAIYLQLPSVRVLCTRVVSTQLPTPKLERHESLVIYYMPTETLAQVKCPTGEGWETSTFTLHGIGMLESVQHCYVSAGQIQLNAEVTGQSEFQGKLPKVIVPAHLPVTSQEETEILSTLTETESLEELLSTMSTHKLQTDVNTLLSLHRQTYKSQNGVNWTAILCITVPATVTLTILYYFSRIWLMRIWKCSRGSPVSSRPTTGDPSPAVGVSRRPESLTVPVSTPASAGNEPGSTHSIYALQNVLSE
jgi:hypothetical protein